MTPPHLTDLPPPPPGRTGWPWTEATPALPPALPGGAPWPRISIVTPSYNQGQFIEETIRSVLLQGYPNLEYLIIDGGSTDASVAIIRKYAPWLTYWASEQDRGQAHAINKGLERATGEIAAYLNSDDVYLSGALKHVAETYSQFGCDIFVGRRSVVNPNLYQRLRSYGSRIKKPFIFPFILGLNKEYEIPQECLFWSHRRYGSWRFDEQYHFCLDVEWFTRIYSGAYVIHSSRPVGWFRLHPESKTSLIAGIATSESRQISDAMTSCRARIDASEAQAILQRYRRVSQRTSLLALLSLWRSFYFQYYHPPYLSESEYHAIPTTRS